MSKREEQRKRKEAKAQAAESRDHTRKLMMKFVMYGVAPVLLLVTMYTLLSQGPTYSTVEIAESDHVRGIGATPVSIVVYADFQCPACATENDTMTRIWPQIRDKAHLVFRHFPITTSHPHSWTASLYAEAASKQGRFWEMHDYLFATQAIWAGMSNVEGEFDSYALELNLDLDRLHADIDSDEVVQKVRNDQRGGNSSGVRSTPAVFINGRLLAQPSADRIIEVVEEEFADAGAAD
ncbi:MAG: DsbA family protein [Pseudohongiellaceae bacterium]